MMLADRTEATNLPTVQEIFARSDELDGDFARDLVDKIYFSTFPGAKESKTFSSWLLDNNVYYSSAENAQPGINGNDALHTIAIYTDGYNGSITIQATLDNQPTSQTSWADIDTLTFTGNETEPKPVNFNGVYSHIRIAASKDPVSTVTKILMRN